MHPLLDSELNSRKTVCGLSKGAFKKQIQQMFSLLKDEDDHTSVNSSCAHLPLNLKVIISKQIARACINCGVLQPETFDSLYTVLKWLVLVKALQISKQHN